MHAQSDVEQKPPGEVNYALVLYSNRSPNCFYILSTVDMNLQRGAVYYLYQRTNEAKLRDSVKKDLTLLFYI